MMLATSPLFASLGPTMLGTSRVKFAPHWMALAVAICRCSPKLSLRSNCTPRYFILVFHSTSCSLKTILGYWKDLLSVTSKASVFSGAICRPLLSNQCFARYRLSLILSSKILTSSAPHTTSALSAKPMMIVATGRKSSYMTFQISGPTRDPWEAPHVISSLRNHFSPLFITHLLLK